MSSQQIVDGIRSVLADVGAFIPVENVNDAADLLEHAEWGEALSLICTQLYEYDVTINESTYKKIESLGQQMAMSAHEWTILRELIRSR